MQISNMRINTHNTLLKQQITFKGDYQTVQKNEDDYVLVPKKDINNNKIAWGVMGVLTLVSLLLGSSSFKVPKM